MSSISTHADPLYFPITNKLQQLYASRGMWSGGAPQGALAGMLGPQIPILSSDAQQTFNVTPAQLAALYWDISSLWIARAIGGHLYGWTLRRMVAAAERGGLDFSRLLAAFPREKQPAVAAPPVAAVQATGPAPFTSVQVPARGKAAAQFRDHVWRTTREFVDFTQSSAYTGGGQ